MWRNLKKHFQDLSPMTLTDALLYISKKKMSDYSDADHYYLAYEKIFNKTIEMIGETSDITAKSIMTLV